MFSNRPGTKLFTAFVLLGGALALAFSFRRDASRPVAPPAATNQLLVLRETPPPADIQIVRPDAPTAEIQPTLLAPPPQAAGEADLTAAEFARLAPPPMMARTYPNRPALSAADSGSEQAVGPSLERSPPQRFHKVRDGDTLEAIAERYLGDRSRWHEIYQQNSRLIERPDLLPLGAKLQIPPKYPLPRQGEAAPQPLPISRGPLVSLSSDNAP